MIEFLGVTAIDGLNGLQEPERSYYEYVLEHGDTGLYEAMPWKDKKQILLSYKGEIEQCTLISAHLNKIPPQALRTIMRSENGWPGADQMSKNGAGDLGIVQINPKVWDVEFKRKGINLDWSHVRDDVCANLYIGGYILSTRIDELKPGESVMKAIANYHRYATKNNKSFHLIYRLKAIEHYVDIQEEYGTWLNGQSLALQGN
jgi:hypothetical protein